MTGLKAAATLPRGFRLHNADSMGLPSTPEPMAQDDGETSPMVRAPSPPRHRFKLKKRNMTMLSAPTQQFLASVEAADVPIPSIEEPEPSETAESIIAYPIITSLSDLHDGSLAVPRTRGCLVTPHTPMPGHALSLSPRCYPDWSIDSALESESSPEPESSRPSTARSTITNSSAFSRASILTEEATFVETDSKPSGLLGTPFEAINMSLAKLDSDDVQMKDRSPGLRGRKVPWTKAMSDHLWATYVMYLNDPKVTLFRTGKNGLPPQGVCIRVSHAAKKSWKGARGISRQPDRSRATTPTIGTFVQWPHTCAATRQHLRDLCRARHTSSFAPVQQLLVPEYRHDQVFARQYRRSTPFGSVFSSRDMHVSLTVSTAESMQPHGPLAQLAMSGPDSSSSEEFPIASQEPSPILNFFGSAPRLLSPAPIPRTNPTVTMPAPASAAAPIGLAEAALISASVPSGAASSAPVSRDNTIGRRGLQSPVRLTRSRSNTLHQRRRSRQLSQAGQPRRIKRPSLGGDLYIDPAKLTCDFEKFEKRRVRSNSEYIPRDQGNVQRPSLDELLKDAPPMPPLPTAHREALSDLQEAPVLAASGTLGSPFPGTLNTNFTFPAHTSQSSLSKASDMHKPFTTANLLSFSRTDLDSEKLDLSARLAYIDSRL